MKILISGDRNWTDKDLIKSKLEEYQDIELVIHGNARGADKLGAQAALELGLVTKAYPADWKTNGKAAGVLRNKQMLMTGPDLVLAFHNDIQNSKGTKHCITEAKRLGIPTILVTNTYTSPCRGCGSSSQFMTTENLICAHCGFVNRP